MSVVFLKRVLTINIYAEVLEKFVYTESFVVYLYMIRRMSSTALGGFVLWLITIYLKYSKYRIKLTIKNIKKKRLKKNCASLTMGSKKSLDKFRLGWPSCVE